MLQHYALSSYALTCALLNLAGFDPLSFSSTTGGAEEGSLASDRFAVWLANGLDKESSAGENNVASTGGSQPCATSAREYTSILVCLPVPIPIAIPIPIRIAISNPDPSPTLPAALSISE